MQQPPPFEYGPPPKKKNNTLSIVLIVVGFVCIGACGFAGYSAYRAGTAVASQVMPVVACTVDMTMMRDAIKKYAEQKGTYPKKETWMDDIEPLLDLKERKELENVPFLNAKSFDSKGAWGCKIEDKEYGFAYNEAFSGKKPTEITAAEANFVLFEVEKAPQRNLAMAYYVPKEKPLPKIMGESREWLAIGLQGSLDFEMGTKTKVSGSSGSDSSKE